MSSAILLRRTKHPRDDGCGMNSRWRSAAYFNGAGMHDDHLGGCIDFSVGVSHAFQATAKAGFRKVDYSSRASQKIEQSTCCKVLDEHVSFS